MKAWVDALESTCGVGLIFHYNPDWDGVDPIKEIKEEAPAGCGWYVAGFVDTPTCHKMYEQLAQEFPIVYQSPVRINTNSGREFFFCIFDAGAVEEE